MRKIIGHTHFIHLLVFLGLLAVAGVIVLNWSILIFFAALSFAGAICSAFIKVLDEIRGEIS